MKKKPQYSAVITSPLGVIGIIVNNNQQLLALHFLPKDTPKQIPAEPLPQQIAEQLNCYFHNAQFRFSAPVHLAGSIFQQRVWEALQAIPSGETRTYGMLAKQLQTSPRAIGQACRTNPLPIIVPCHRVVATKHMGGYSGHTEGKFADIKKWLLKHECANTIITTKHT